MRWLIACLWLGALSGCLADAPDVELRQMTALDALAVARDLVHEPVVQIQSHGCAPNGTSETWMANTPGERIRFTADGVVFREPAVTNRSEVESLRMDSPDAAAEFWGFYEPERAAFEAAPFRCESVSLVGSAGHVPTYWLVVAVYGPTEEEGTLLVAWIDSLGGIHPQLPAELIMGGAWFQNGLTGPVPDRDVMEVEIDVQTAWLRSFIAPSDPTRFGPLGPLAFYPSVPHATVLLRVEAPGGEVYEFEDTLEEIRPWRIERPMAGTWRLEVTGLVPTGVDYGLCMPHRTSGAGCEPLHI